MAVVSGRACILPWASSRFGGRTLLRRVRPNVAPPIRFGGRPLLRRRGPNVAPPIRFGVRSLFRRRGIRRSTAQSDRSSINRTQRKNKRNIQYH